MRKRIGLFGLAAFAALLAGCNTNYINQPSSELDVQAVAHVKPIISVGEKIEGMAAVTRTFWFFISAPGKFAEGVNYGTNYYKDESISGSVFGDTVEMAKAAAAYRACAENKADFIVCPRYVISVSDYIVYKKVQAKVSGYKGTLLDVKVPNDNDQQDSNMQKYLENISDGIDGIKDSTSEMVTSFKKDDVQKENPAADAKKKDVIKRESNADAALKLDSKLDFTNK